MASTTRRPAATPNTQSRQAPQEVRIIGGQWKRTRLAVADRPGLRPTPDRVRETLFNWLGQDLGGWQVVDAFAGTGALGLEAASRGAARVLLIEQDAALVDGLRALVERLQGAGQTVTVRRGNAVTLLPSLASGSQDLVLLDPPFDARLHDKVLPSAAALLRPGGWLYLEAPEAWAAERVAAHGLALERHLRAGAVHAHLLRRPLPALEPSS
ncbi:16S rRNA (guanine(966)-N(2))-methyltransferase RsmD [Ramlibacter sp. AW1]|uniref:16S rRNA (Guanine(966)-N(2))-methyltransferase RsmD n=1 Tax=Ramlibacter aurantiacus TaxID=2801330 RepID=A0A936ZJL5_9BURK|nr:16S rRNA (guanine(966)-N(2))-methyltransferase RsmD [Ramlibacter aurantiacus]MBL0422112.1 16S rRNA (guanine(966)-N(2))-methyltransferase RsmD [Ramlibacter aurantiacus]